MDFYDGVTLSLLAALFALAAPALARCRGFAQLDDVAVPLPLPTSTLPPLTDATVILFDGEPVRFGDLMMQDRKTVEWDSARRLYVGGYPF